MLAFIKSIHIAIIIFAVLFYGYLLKYIMLHVQYTRYVMWGADLSATGAFALVSIILMVNVASILIYRSKIKRTGTLISLLVILSIVNITLALFPTLLSYRE
jgi:hypothetical protein